MPATRKTPPSQGRPKTESDPFGVDTTDLPMTPVMTALHETSKVQAVLAAAQRNLDTVSIDLAAMAVAEGQSTTHTLRAMGRTFKWRAQFARLLAKRNINVGNWRGRLRDVEPAEVPSYASPDTIQAARELADSLNTMLQDVTSQRDKQYPALHDWIKPRIEGDVPEVVDLQHRRPKTKAKAS